jgi:hypothetical protein
LSTVSTAFSVFVRRIPVLLFGISPNEHAQLRRTASFTVQSMVTELVDGSRLRSCAI